MYGSMIETMTENTEAVVEPAVLNELKEILAEDFPLLITTFIEDSAERMQRLNAAVTASDATIVKAEAHALKGSSRNLGANPLGDLLAKMEAIGNAGDLASAPALLAEIHTHLQQTQDFLRSQV